MLEKAFEDWLTEGGARTFNIQPATFAGNLRGIQALKHIDPGIQVYTESSVAIDCLSQGC